MGQYHLKMPDVGEGVVEAEIVAWHVGEGDTVEEDEDLVDVMTDKATVEIPSPVSGKVVSRTGAPGDVVAVGTEILVIETDAAVDTDGPPEAGGVEAAPTPAPAPAPAPSPDEPAARDAAPASASTQPRDPAPATSQPERPAQSGTGASPANAKVLASPAVRARALELDVDLAGVPGSGPAGRVTREDLDDFIAAGGRMIQRTAPVGGPARAARTGVREEKVIGLRRKIAQNMEAAWSIPMITYVEEVDVTELEALRRSLNDDRTADQPKLTLLPFLATALARALPDVPQASAHYDAEAGTLTLFEAAHIGIATATENGLMVPVLRHGEAMDVWQMAGEISRLSAAAREGTAKREALSGSSITITSLGAMGGVVTTPLINVPETAIIGVNKIQERPVFDGAGRVVPRLFMNLSSSFDHRIVDGHDAARLIQKVRALMESPARLFM